MAVKPKNAGSRAWLNSAASQKQARAALTARLQARRPQIEEAVLTRVFAISDATDTANPEYAEGLRAAVSAALDFGITVIELGEDRSPPVPAVLLTQARVAARNGVNLDTVLRRYFAGYSLLGDFLIEEVEAGDLLRGSALKRLLRAQAALFDRLLAAVSEEHAREASGRLDTSEQRHAERIQRLLDGELLDTSELAYDLEAHHLGAIAKGPGAAAAVRDLANSLDRRLLTVCRGEGTVWAWLGSHRRLDLDELEARVSSLWPAELTLALGEPGDGLGGWRLTHQQARAAVSIAQRSPDSVVRYADVALVASMLQDDLLITSLRELYLVPLEEERDGGEVLRQTLRAYFAAERNLSSAAAALGVSRRTVSNRLSAIEARIGRSLSTSAAEMEAALRLDDADAPPLPN